jgi:hypothetical protein
MKQENDHVGEDLEGGGRGLFQENISPTEIKRNR